MSTYLLLLIDLPEDLVAPLALKYKILRATATPDQDEALKNHGAQIKIILTNGTTGVSKDIMDRASGLQIICCLGAGHENVDLDWARRNNIVVTNGHGANAECVADHAMSLLLSIVRDIPALNEEVKAGVWKLFREPRPQVSGKRLGIFGLGTIGMAIAKRASAFNMHINYHNRSARSDVSYSFFESAKDLAENSDFLIVASPGGRETYHKINGEVLQALGPHGFLVNIARGTVVDTEALIEAVENDHIAGAALDVVEGEPNISDRLKQSRKILITPHMAGRSPETMTGMVALVEKNLDAFFKGQPVISPVI